MRKILSGWLAPSATLSAAAMVAGLLILPTANAEAGTLVRRIDADSLQVIETRGRPPHKRRVVHASDAELYAHYEAILENPGNVFVNVARVGGPGKYPWLNRHQDSGEQAMFARFEETSEEDDSSDTRRWRGAPGKGIASPNN